MKHSISSSDKAFLNSFIAGEIKAGQFNHKDHIRLAYIILAENPFDRAYRNVKQLLQLFLSKNYNDDSLYHETMTQAWLLAVQHFMETSKPAHSFDDFINNNTRLLEKEIMYTHYTKPLIDSDTARQTFVQPDLDPIPTYQ